MTKLYRSHIFSPSDLTRFMESPFASWMDRFAREVPEQAPRRDPANALCGTLAEKGYAHENVVEAEFRERGLSVVRIEGHSAAERRDLSLAAMHSGADIIVQARLEAAPFAGYSDFLVRVPGRSTLGDYHYEVWDTKLASRPEPRFLIQLCCYAEMLESLQGVLPKSVVIVLGNGSRERFRTHDFSFYYQTLKAQFLRQQAAFSADAMPDPADSPTWGDWSQFAEQQLLMRDHLFQVATVTRGQIKKLNQAGIETLTQLAEADPQSLTGPGGVRGINSGVLTRLQSQARIQLQTRRQQAAGSTIPCFEIIPPVQGEKNGLALLPPHSPLDLFFDIEGFPLVEGGLEYLWGCTFFDDEGKRAFRDFWAHNRDEEQTAFRGFIEWAYARWRQDPAMHIYHYANYEIAACRRLMGRYGVCEYEVDQLLRNEVFVDLYKIVKGGLLLGEPRYSIKNVEHLYRGKRETEVGTGGDSVVVYEAWRNRHTRGEESADWRISQILGDIRAYNIDDCNSTQELVAWLREQQVQHGITYIAKGDVVEPEVREEMSERIRLRDRLLARAGDERTTDPDTAQLTENLAWSLEFHRREAKPVFWRLFERLGLSHLELLDDLDCLACCQRTERAPYKRTSRARNLCFEYRFDPGQEFKGAAKQFFLLGVEGEDGQQVKVDYIAEESDLEHGRLVVQAKSEPPPLISLVPYEYVNPKPIPESIDACVADYEQGTLCDRSSAILDFLKRVRPRFDRVFSPPQGGAIAPSQDPAERLQQIITAVRHLDSSYLTIQGPPGAGKSYTGKHIIADLVKDGARVGIASNSHKAINNLLLSSARECLAQRISARFACTKETEPALGEYGVAILKNSGLVNYIGPGCVIGTTAWGFAREDMAGQLDYLFIDEAGQVAIANLIAMSRAARNLILMGDQMQLGQPSQGTHPAESGLSVLDYLLHATPTIPQDMGVFLGTTYRMHSRINRFISEHIYEGKLESHPDNDRRFIRVPEEYTGPLSQEAGIVFVPVHHEGNTQAADEEVAMIAELASTLLDRVLHTGQTDEPTRAINWSDMLFVAPYNHQVSKLRQALGEQAQAGSVDKFQGQEAPIVFLSMCASDASESPRGIDFLFDRHRLNVALSRAQCLAIVVGNPVLGSTPVSSVEQMAKVNLFNALCHYELKPDSF